MQKFSDYFFPQLCLCINFDKNGLGNILGEFLTKSSGHPGSEGKFKAWSATLVCTSFTRKPAELALDLENVGLVCLQENVKGRKRKKNRFFSEFTTLKGELFEQ
jgi:hypothetical protein